MAGERVAVFRYGNRLSAVSNVCQHQNGPLGEGKIVNGCIVCPWHGYQYVPETGASPAPFTERVPTFSVRVEAGRVLVDPRPHPPGTYGRAREDRVMADLDEFYIGYEPATPPAVARRVRRAVVAAVLVGLATGALALSWHHRLAAARFDFGRPHRAEGVLHKTPYPFLETTGTRVWLAARGKHGAEAEVRGTPEGMVTLEGSSIVRGAHEILEVVPGSVRAVPGGAVPATPPLDRLEGETVRLTGEIVDSKCFLGVMNPGEGTVHRDCARVCLRGGLPPMLLVRGAAGEEALVLLVSDAGAPIGRELAELAGVPVVVPGRLIRDGGTLVLRTRVDAITRVP